MTDGRTARERAVEEARKATWAALAPCLDLDFDLSDDGRVNKAINALILAARLAERARVREVVESAWWTTPAGDRSGGVQDALDAIDQMEAK
jgi:hypothetical protein